MPTFTGFTREQLAWAAGFFDGEGHVGHRRGKDLRISITQIDAEVLERFRTAVGGLGKVRGPYTTSTKPVWFYTAQRFESAQAIIAMLWAFLSGPKREQSARALRGVV